MDEVAGGYGLVEAPLWLPSRGLCFSDVLNGGVFLLGRDGRVSTLIEKRRGVGGMALHADGGLVVSGRNIAWVGADGRTDVILDAASIPGAVGFNDLTTDAAGRIYVGSLAYRVFADPPKPGLLHLIDVDGEASPQSDGILLTNGLGVSPDGARLYHSDSRAGLVRVYDVLDGGRLGPWRPFAHLGDGRVPDGLKVGSDGSVWVADARGGRVAVFESDGRPRFDIETSRPMVTSLAFGGDDLKDLYIVTGSEGAPTAASGTVFRVRTEVAGLPLARASVSHRASVSAG